MPEPTCGRLRRAFSASRTEIAASTKPGMPASIRRATSSPTAPSPASPTLRGTLGTAAFPTLAAARAAR